MRVIEYVVIKVRVIYVPIKIIRKPRFYVARIKRNRSSSTRGFYIARTNKQYAMQIVVRTNGKRKIFRSKIAVSYGKLTLIGFFVKRISVAVRFEQGIFVL